MKRKKLYINLAFVIVCGIILLLNNIIKQTNIKKERYKLENECYMEYLYIQGDCEYKIDTVKVKNKEIKKLNQLYVDVAYYNLCNEDCKTSVEELLSEYESFCNSDGTWEHLKAYYDFEYGDKRMDGSYSEFCSEVIFYLWDNYEIYIYEATLAQIQEAINYAIKEINIEAY